MTLMTSRQLHLFEFMDQEWVPSSLRTTLREILECSCSEPFRPYYRWVADEVLKAAKEGGYKHIVEAGAGPAPITKLMAKDSRSDGLKLIPCDINPDRPAYEQLARNYPARVVPRYDRVDISTPQEFPPRTLVFLSAIFHHIPPQQRLDVIRSLTVSASRVFIFEPLRNHWLSRIYTLGTAVPGLLLPLWNFNRPGKIRRFFWCWFCPIAPPMLWWDGEVTSVRIWRTDEWRNRMPELLPSDRELNADESMFSQVISW